ncbi:MAG: hypothetical protein WCL34_08165 [Methylococcaceae bacterium]
MAATTEAKESATAKQISEVTGYSLLNAKMHSKARQAAIKADPECQFEPPIMLSWIDKNFPKSGAVQTHAALPKAPTPTEVSTSNVPKHSGYPSGTKIKDVGIRGVEAKLIHIKTKSGQRKSVWLEPAFCTALEHIGNTPAFLTGVYESQRAAWIAANPDKDIDTEKGGGFNLASAVRCALMAKFLVKNPQEVQP